MIDALVAAALVGTAREPRAPRSVGSPLDELVAAQPNRCTELAILLAAGAADLYRSAGMIARKSVVRLPVCPPESRPELGRDAVELLDDLLHGRHPLAEWSYSKRWKA